MDVDTNGHDFQFITLGAHAWKTENIPTHAPKLVQSTLADKIEFFDKNSAIDAVIERVKKGNITLKLISREISAKGPRKYVAYSSFAEYWGYHVRNINHKKPLYDRFRTINDHEILTNELAHCIYTCAFFDVDCTYNMDNVTDAFVKERRDELLRKTHVFCKQIGQVLNLIAASFNPELANDSNIGIMIQESSALATGKISFHGIVRHKNLIFDDVTVIKTVVLVALWECFKGPEGIEFCFETHIQDSITGIYHNWLDLRVYAAERTFRCLFSTKLDSRNRPLLPIYYNGVPLNPENDPSTWFNKEIFFDALINIPNAWLLSTRPNTPLYIVKPTTSAKNEEMFTQFVAELEQGYNPKHDLKTIVRAMEDLVDYYKPVCSFAIASDQEQISLDAMIVSSKNTILGRNKRCKPNAILEELARSLKKLHTDVVTSPELKLVLDKYFENNENAISLLTREKALACVHALHVVLSEEAYRETLNYVTGLKRIVPHDKKEQQILIRENEDMKKIVQQANSTVSKEKMVPYWVGLFVKATDKYVHQFFQILENTSDESCFKECRMTKAQALDFYKEQIFESFIMVFHSENHYCYIKGGCHSSNTVYYMVDLVRLQWWQGCYSKACAANFMSGKEQKNSQLKVKLSENARSEKFELFRDDDHLMKVIRAFKDSLFKEHLSVANVAKDANIQDEMDVGDN